MKTRMVGRCACLSTIMVTGTFDGCNNAIRLWRELDHSKPGCRRVTKEEQQKLKRLKKRADRQPVKVAPHVDSRQGTLF